MEEKNLSHRDDADKTILDKNDVPPGSISRLIVPLILTYILIGTIIYPYWWYLLIFEGQLLNIEHWFWAFSFLGQHYLLPALIAFIIIYFIVTTSRPTIIYKLLKRVWSSAMHIFLGNKAGYILAVISFGLIGSLLTLSTRSEKQAKQYKLKDQQFLAKIRESLSKSKFTDEDVLPIKELTSFMYLSKESVDSLYGQHEPELIPTSIIEEIKNSKEYKGGISIETFLTTEAGKSLAQKKLTEYRQSQKNSERKFKDLLNYLYGKKALKRYRNLQVESEEIKELDQAIHLITKKYSLPVDQIQLRLLRDRLLSNEIQRLESELRSLKGHILVEGDWFVDIQADSYMFKRAFVDNVSNPPICEVKLRKTELSNSYRDIIQDSNKEPIRLSIFGNVITGLSENSRIIRLTPIAIY